MNLISQAGGSWDPGGTAQLWEVPPERQGPKPDVGVPSLEQQSQNRLAHYEKWRGFCLPGRGRVYRRYMHTFNGPTQKFCWQALIWAPVEGWWYGLELLEEKLEIVALRRDLGIVASILVLSHTQILQ